MLEQRLREIIPKPINKFKQLRKKKYYFVDGWRKDKNGEMCLYYVVGNNNKKRVVISEVEKLIRNCLTQGQISREDFRIYCPVSESAGPCGFAVTVRMLEYLGIGQYLGRGLGFEIIDVDSAERTI